MRKIDSETIQKVIDAANIVEVVSDFVSLKRRGANYIGLCPFHNERTPSFSVSPSRGICKCFSCGKGGTPVNFIMEHEQMTFQEAIRYLAKKYHIEIKEHDMTDADRLREKTRESMFAVNEFALKYFEQTLTETDDGRDIGLAYFRERGINDAAIKRFHLGYSLEKGNGLLAEARKAGFSEEVLISTGLIVKREDGTMYDRFKGRVIYPVHTISGKVVAFGGRTLRNDKKVAKYVNSPESEIYSKSRELYGLYQAKRAIVEKKKCILVEGYMDVISMSQLGIENIVASSGTSLTEGQIRLIHRFTDEVTVIYDSDAAGIKASLRGIDMLLAEGLKIKVVLLPDGDDPDSFAQSHSLSEVEQYLAEHEEDFISFKTRILLDGGVKNDPIRLSSAINDIVQSISVIPDQIARSIYINQCAHTFGINEAPLLAQMKKFITERIEKQADKRRLDEARQSLNTPGDINAGGAGETTPAENPPADTPGATRPATQAGTAQGATPAQINPRARALRKVEAELIRLIVKYGMVDMPYDDENGQSTTISVLRYIVDELAFDNIKMTNEAYGETIDEALRIADTIWEQDYARADERFLLERQKEWNAGQEKIRATASSLSEIKVAEEQLTNEINDNYSRRVNDFVENYLIQQLGSSPVDRVRTVATELGTSRYRLSKYHSKYAKVDSERDRLFELLPLAINALKEAIISCDMGDIQAQIKAAAAQVTLPGADVEAINATINALMTKVQELQHRRNELARLLGERVIRPRAW